MKKREGYTKKRRLIAIYGNQVYSQDLGLLFEN